MTKKEMRKAMTRKERMSDVVRCDFIVGEDCSSGTYASGGVQE